MDLLFGNSRGFVKGKATVTENIIEIVTKNGVVLVPKQRHLFHLRVTDFFFGHQNDAFLSSATISVTVAFPFCQRHCVLAKYYIGEVVLFGGGSQKFSKPVFKFRCLPKSMSSWLLVWYSFCLYKKKIC